MNGMECAEINQYAAYMQTRNKRQLIAMLVTTSDVIIPFCSWHDVKLHPHRVEMHVRL